MPESFAALENNEWDSWISYFADCAVIKGWSGGRKEQFLAILIHGSAFRQLQNLATGVWENYATLKEALREQFVLKERVEVHKVEFRAKHRERDEKLPNFASSLRRQRNGSIDRCVGGSRSTDETPRVRSKNDR